jgi:hypothetical protein
VGLTERRALRVARGNGCGEAGASREAGAVRSGRAGSGGARLWWRQWRAAPVTATKAGATRKQGWRGADEGVAPGARGSGAGAINSGDRSTAGEGGG